MWCKRCGYDKIKISHKGIRCKHCGHDDVGFGSEKQNPYDPYNYHPSRKRGRRKKILIPIVVILVISWMVYYEIPVPYLEDQSLSFLRALKELSVEVWGMVSVVVSSSASLLGLDQPRTGQLANDTGEGRDSPVTELHAVTVGMIHPTAYQPQKESGRIITFAMDGNPSVADKNLVLEGVADGFEKWDRLNKNLVFEFVPEGDDNSADIMVSWWQVPKPDRAGQATYSQPFSGQIHISLGDYDCNGSYVQRSKNAIMGIAMHEIGHILGAGHTLNESHLMYGNVPPYTQDNFESFGFIFPKDTDGYYVGYDALEKEYDLYADEIEQLKHDRQVPQDRYDQLKEQYDQYPRVAPDRGTYEEAKKVYDRLNTATRILNDMVKEYNDLVNIQNTIVSEMTCYPGVGSASTALV